MQDGSQVAPAGPSPGVLDEHREPVNLQPADRLRLHVPVSGPTERVSAELRTGRGGDMVEGGRDLIWAQG